VAALCMELAGECVAGQTLEAYLAVFTHHYLRAKNQQPIVWEGTAHQRLRELSLPGHRALPPSQDAHPPGIFGSTSWASATSDSCQPR